MAEPAHDFSAYKRLKALEDQIQSYAGGGNGGDNDEMNTARIIKLEEFAEDAKQRLTRVETRLEHIDREVSNVKWWIIGAVLTIVLTTVATVIGTGVGIQQMTVSTFQAAGAQNQPAPAQQQPIIINVPAAAATPAAPPQ
ncbi:hypothetical protein [Comamonas kerstersii]|uniref:hypothetical protein n=1 Tax=Comamonas kerstersii TaxID=225992 RepID=UPI0026DD1A6D|nr:hypothetical protein [Comamonas kerstersii]